MTSGNYLTELNYKIGQLNVKFMSQKVAFLQEFLKCELPLNMKDDLDSLELANFKISNCWKTQSTLTLFGMTFE